MDLGGNIGSYESSFVENFGQDNNIIKENLNANDVKGISCNSISKEDEQKQISA